VKIALASDHAGYLLKNSLIPIVRAEGHRVLDLGSFNQKPSDYPDYAERLARSLQEGRADRGILVCGSGVGASIAANKFLGIRAALCHDSYSAHQGVEHDQANILCLGSRIVGEELAKDLVRIFLKARFSGEARHRRRVGKIVRIEQEELIARKRLRE
jgi:RpiB/LacA/LacB family sugar-phosphate isomerase